MIEMPWGSMDRILAMTPTQLLCLIHEADPAEPDNKIRSPEEGEAFLERRKREEEEWRAPTL